VAKRLPHNATMFGFFLGAHFSPMSQPARIEVEYRGRENLFIKGRSRRKMHWPDDAAGAPDRFCSGQHP
jgi:hypothetical protein